VEVGVSMNQAIGASKSQQVGVFPATYAGKGGAENIGKNKSVSVREKVALSSGEDCSISGGNKGVMTSAGERAIKVDKAMILMKKSDGSAINGYKGSVKASAKALS